jgi:hypothetical protein
MANGLWDGPNITGLEEEVVYNKSLGITIPFSVTKDDGAGCAWDTTSYSSYDLCYARSVDGSSEDMIVRSVADFDLTNVQFIEVRYASSGRDDGDVGGYDYDQCDAQLRIKDSATNNAVRATADPDYDLSWEQLIDVSELSGMHYFEIYVNANLDSGYSDYTRFRLYGINFWKGQK